MRDPKSSDRLRLEKYRITTGKLGSTAAYGNNGVFLIPFTDNIWAQVIVSDGLGWEHVSVVTILWERMHRTPTWDEMCKTKDYFWGEDECVIQYHPPKSEYVNAHPHCLHLWKPIGADILLPPKEMLA